MMPCVPGGDTKLVVAQIKDNALSYGGMSMVPIKVLLQEAEEAFHASEMLEALHLFAHIVQVQPENLDARLRIADSLLALGMVQQAAEVYTAFARHTANAGYPLRCLVAIKVLSALEPQFAGLQQKIAEKYSSESGCIGRSTRHSTGDTEEMVSRPPNKQRGLEVDTLIREALALATHVPPRAAIYPEKLPPIPLLTDLPTDAFLHLIAMSSLLRVRAGQRIISQGEPGSSFFMMARGSVEVVHEEKNGTTRSIACLGSGSVFGEMALVSSSPRTAHVIARADTDLLVFEKADLEAAAQSRDTIAEALGTFTSRRLLHNLLNTAPFFAPLDRTQRVAMVKHFQTLQYASHVEVLREGEEGPGLFVILHGEVQVYKREGDEQVLLANLHPGDVFGEMALLTGQPASATVATMAPTQLMLLAREHFQALIEAVPAIRSYVESLTAERAESTELVLGLGFDTWVETQESEEAPRMSAAQPPPPPRSTRASSVPPPA